MRSLIIYFNEYSSPDSISDNQGLENLRRWFLLLWAQIDNIRKIRTDYKLSISTLQWNEILFDKPLFIWFEHWLSRDQFRWLLSKTIDNQDEVPDLFSEVYFNNRPARGLTRAHLSQSWAFSFPQENSPWLEPIINCREIRIDEQGNSGEADCIIKHISKSPHVNHWQSELADYGKIVASTNVISSIQGHSVVMYPLDHSYPHLHLVENSTPRRTIAKYRIDVFERMEGTKEFDKIMCEWITDKNSELLRSWERCKRGGHPYSIN